MSGSAQRFLARFGMAALLFAATVTAQAAPVARSVRGAHNPDTLRLFLAGPCTLLVLLASLAVIVLIAAGFGGLEKLAGLGTRAARRLEMGLVAPTLWGICACLLVFALAALLFATKFLALLGVVVVLLAFCLAGLGTGVAAAVFGRNLAIALGSVELDDLASLRLGLWIFLLASAIPFIGWIVALLAIAGGLGAVFQSLAAKRE